jgi:glycosyltransferase involved in cell wall biosynthesis
MRIGVDCRLSGTQHAGIGRYVENLILRLPLIGTDIEWVYFFGSQDQIDATVGLSDLVSKFKIEIKLTSIKHYSVAEQLKLSRVFSKEKLDLLHVPHFNVPVAYQGLLVITIHDLLWHQYQGLSVTTLPRWQYWLKYLGYRFVTSRAIQKATAIVVPTETVSAELTSYYPKINNKVVVTKEGHLFSGNNTFKKSSTKTSEIAGQIQNNLLFVGSLYPHKNLKVVLNALRDVPTLELDIVGSRTVFQDQTKKLVAELGLKKRVHFLGYQSDSDLYHLYQNSLALIQPSLSEGFGLTGIEAMATGAAVIASDIPVFHEIYQDAALFFDPNSPQDLAKTLNLIVDKKNSKTLLDSLKTKSGTVSKQYSWDNMTEETLAVYNTILNK